MNFRIADTFTASLARLTGDEQKAAKTTAFDLQLNPASPGLSFHKLDKARDKSFWSVRASRDVRLIVHRAGASLLLCYVAHHDDAYAWAERRRLETHPATGAAQLVEVRERVQEIMPIGLREEVAGELSQSKATPLVFASLSDDELLGWGVPHDWLATVRAADEDGILAVAAHLPAEAAEALLVLATGGTPQRGATLRPGADPFEHPDAQRRFRVMEDAEALQRALDSPWDQWTVFLHPAQREWVEREQSGPARVSGSAGTGKTIVALHRAVHLARTHPESRVLLTTFSDPLARTLQALLRRLVGRTPRLAERIDVMALDAWVERLYGLTFGKPKFVGEEDLARRIVDSAARVDASAAPWLHAAAFLNAEWNEVIDPWQVESLEAYRATPRPGRKTRLAATQREAVWPAFAAVRESLARDGLTTRPALYARLATHQRAGARPPHDFVVVDEAQDLSVPQLRFLAAARRSRPGSLFFAGDSAQRIFQPPFSWRALGIDIRGRAKTLRVNYRTSHQIRCQADRLLGSEVHDADGNVDLRTGTVSVFNGPSPLVRTFEHEADETAGVAAWLQEVVSEGIGLQEIGIFVRSDAQLERARAACAEAGLRSSVLGADLDTETGKVSVGTMHLAKGLEFRAVAVMACDDEIVPLQARIDEIVDAADLAPVYESERQLLYVAFTRARDRLLVSAVRPASEFLRDLA